MRKLISAAIASVFLFGCSYTGHLKSGFHSTVPKQIQKTGISVALFNSQELKDLRIQEYTGGRTFTFYINPAFNEAVIRELSGVFRAAIIVDSRTLLPEYDLQVVPSIQHQYLDGSAWTAQYRYRITTNLTFLDKRQRIIENLAHSEDIVISPTAADNILGFLTGFSLFLLSPITIPMQTQIGGDNAKEIFEEGISRSLRVLSEKVASSRKIFGVNY